MFCVISSPGKKAEPSGSIEFDSEELQPKKNKQIKYKVADRNMFFIF